MVRHLCLTVLTLSGANVLVCYQHLLTQYLPRYFYSLLTVTLSPCSLISQN